MQLDILTPEKNIFSGEVDIVRLPGVDGSFELLNNHAPIISALGNGVVTFSMPNPPDAELKEITDKLKKDSSKQNAYQIGITSGFVECLNNNISVLVEGTTLEF